jgi:aminomethyltransferase
VSHNWRIWSGYLAASCYQVQHEVEYFAIRSTSGLIDVSPLYKYEVCGRDALRLLNRVLTRNVSKCSINQAMYSCLCDEKGKVIQDGTVFRLGEDAFRLNLAEPSLRWLQQNAVGLEVRIEDVSEEIAALAVQGPSAGALLSRLTDGDVPSLKFYRLIAARVGGIPAIVSRTGYTGDLGYEVWVAANLAEPLWDLLMKEGKELGLLPAGMLALDLTRLEAGFILIDVDYTSAEKALIRSQESSPFEISLGWTVDLDKEGFVGRRALLEEKERGHLKKLIGLEIDWKDFERLHLEVGLAPQIPRAAWRGGVPVYRKGRQIGRATTGGWSPILKKYIAVATVASPDAVVGTELKMELTVEYERKQVKAKVVKLPFFDPPRKKA